MIFIDIFARCVRLLIDAALLGIFARTILSFFASEDNRIAIFLACITEPFITPVRFLMYKFNILQNSPIDWSVTFTYIILLFVGNLLPAI